jgi:hypothetical protein
VRVPTPTGWYLVALWVASSENTDTIKQALQALRDNVHCSNPTCMAEAERMSVEFAKAVNCMSASSLITKEKMLGIIEYFQRYWHHNRFARSSFIDMRLLQLRNELGCPYHVSTGSNEGGHKWWDKHFFNMLRNNQVMRVLELSFGKTSTGVAKVGMFEEEQQRYLTNTQPRPECIDSHIRQMKAYHAFLVYGEQAVVFPSGCPYVYVHPMNTNSIRRHNSSETRTEKKKLPEFMLDMHGALFLNSEGQRVPEYTSGEDVWYVVFPSSGRCLCLSWARYGVCTARGQCKHMRLLSLVNQAKVHEQNLAQVGHTCFAELSAFIRRLENSKPKTERNEVLLQAACVQSLLQALETQASVPPTGKGYRSSPSTVDTCALSEEKTLTCMYNTNVCGDLGMIFCQTADTDGKVTLMSFRPYHQNGVTRTGPVEPFSGMCMCPGDVLLRVYSGYENFAFNLREDGSLNLESVPSTVKAIEMCFMRVVGFADRDKGGRPQARAPKYPRTTKFDSGLRQRNTKDAEVACWSKISRCGNAQKDLDEIISKSSQVAKALAEEDTARDSVMFLP